jgi:glycosyltransferase involved in cell wall biosynthesis
MSTNKTFLFVSIDGMTDSLGQSQVLPYLINLAKKGHKIGIVSCEKKENWDLNHHLIQRIVSEANIDWSYCFYKSSKPLISQLQNFLSLKKIAVSEVKKNKGFTILHCRSYLPGLIGLYSKKKFNTGFIFDMRGFWADERIEGGIWNKNNIIGAFLYAYFKKKEKEMIVASDAIISLTYKAKQIIIDWNLIINNNKIQVIPCCVDLEHFSKKNVSFSHFELLKNQLPQLKNKFVLSYIGSIGTWYMADEMLAFFKILSNKIPAVFLIITKDSPELLYSSAQKAGVDVNNLIIKSSSRSDMPYYIALSNASVFFINPTFSKLASSPTKMGEILSMGIPIATNTGIGDVDDIIHQTNCGVTISQFDQANYQSAADDLLKNINSYEENAVTTATIYFSLIDGVEKYDDVYRLF